MAKKKKQKVAAAKSRRAGRRTSSRPSTKKSERPASGRRKASERVLEVASPPASNAADGSVDQEPDTLRSVRTPILPLPLQETVAAPRVEEVKTDRPVSRDTGDAPTLPPRQRTSTQWTKWLPVATILVVGVAVPMLMSSTTPPPVPVVAHGQLSIPQQPEVTPELAYLRFLPIMVEEAEAAEAFKSILDNTAPEAPLVAPPIPRRMTEEVIPEDEQADAARRGARMLRVSTPTELVRAAEERLRNKQAPALGESAQEPDDARREIDAARVALANVQGSQTVDGSSLPEFRKKLEVFLQ